MKPREYVSNSFRLATMYCSFKGMLSSPPSTLVDVRNHHFSTCAQRCEGRARSERVPKRLSRTESRDGDDTDAVGAPVAEATSCHHDERRRIAVSLVIDFAGHPQ